MIRHLILAFLFILPFYSIADEPAEFPIIADILHTKLYDDIRFHDIHNAGFNACLCRCDTEQDIKNVLDIAKTYDIKLIIFSYSIVNHPEKVVPAIKAHSSMWQYYLMDEPRLEHLEKLQDVQKRIARYDQDAKFYINLLPNSSKDALKLMGVEKYPEYLRAFNTIPQPQISYDFYPVQGKVVRGDKWYSILDDIRQESQRTRRPFWAYVLCVPHFIYPMPTIGHLRLQCYINLAYGAQGIQYFSYSTPEPTKNYDFHDGPLLRNGEKSATYYLVQKMNAELKPVASLFWHSTVIDIEHRKCIDGEVVVSHFRKDGKRYTCFVNKSAEDNVTVALRPADYTQRVRKDMKAESVKSRYTLPAGDILILMDK